MHGPFLDIFLQTASGRLSRTASFDLLRWIILRSDQVDAALSETNKQRVKDELGQTWINDKILLNSGLLTKKWSMATQEDHAELGNPGVYHSSGVGIVTEMTALESSGRIDVLFSLEGWCKERGNSATPIFQNDSG